MKTMKLAVLAAIVATTTACATSPNKIQTTYVSPLQYGSYDCGQITREMDRVDRRANQLHANLKKEADADKAQMAVGAILFWPALFFLEGGDGPEAAEYAHLKGEREALQTASIEQRCGVVASN